MSAPYRLVSLLEMLEFNASKFIDVLNVISAFGNYMHAAMINKADLRYFDLRDQTYQDAKQSSNNLYDMLKTMGLPASTASASKIKNYLSVQNGGAETSVRLEGENLARFIASVQELPGRLRDELEGMVFLELTLDEKSYFSPTDPLFGPDVASKMPMVLEDVDEAGKSFALGRYTATVFHLMRVMERGVQAFGSRLSISPLDKNNKDKNWQIILDGINAAIKSMDQGAESTKKYAATSNMLYSVKLAWRNEVMHPKATYTEKEARDILVATKAFMTEVASFL